MNAPGRRTLALSLLVGLATMPDALVPIALKSAVIDRWGVTLADAHWFAAIALLGAVLSVALLKPIERRWSPALTIALVSLINALALCLMWAPVSFEVALGLRLVTGAADMVTLAVLLGLLEAGDPGRAGRRYGPAALAIMLGLSAGFMLGGMLSAAIGSSIFLVGAAFSVLLAVAAGGSGGLLTKVFVVSTKRVAPVRYWPTLVFSFSDRALSAVVSVTASLYLLTEGGMSERLVGSALGLVLLLLALGSWPAGLLADRIGPLPVRVLAVVGYAGAFAMLAAAPWVPAWVVVLSLIVMGLSGSGLAPSTYVLASRKGRGAFDMGGLHAAGSAGYLSGLLGAGVLLAMGTSMTVVFQIVFLGFATVYLLLNLPAIAAMAGWRLRRLDHINGI
jgi:MFS family permease